jgi:hypothetical protein
MCLKFDKNVFMNCFHSLAGGIFGGLIVAFALGQNFPSGNFNFYILFVVIIIGVAILDLILMAFINYIWGKKD